MNQTEKENLIKAARRSGKQTWTLAHFDNYLDRLMNLEDGVPCGHVGCLHHISHPCEGCGRVAGVRKSVQEK